MGLKKQFIIFITFALTALALISCENNAHSGTISGSGSLVGTPAKAAAKVGSRAPEFQSLTLGGKPTKLGDLRGRPVIINFWATWCTPCKKEMPDIQKIFESSSSNNLIVLAINFDEPEPTVERFVQELSLTFPVVLDPDKKISALYGVYGLPTTFFVDSGGVIRYTKIGPFLSKDEIVSRLKTIIQVND